MTRLLLALGNWRRRASEASLGLPLGILAVTATFWLVVWLADQALQGSISPVGVLVRIYGTGAFVMLTLLMVAIAVWMIVQRLGYRDVFFDGTGDSAEQQSPAPKWDSAIPDFTGQITKLVSSMDAPASPLTATAPGESAAPTTPAAGNPPRNDDPADECTPSADQAAPPAGGESGQKAAPAPKTAPQPAPTKQAASPAADAPAAAKSAAPSPSPAPPAAKSPIGKSATGKSAPGKSDPSKNAPGKKAQAKSCASKPLLKRKGRK